MEQNGKFSGYFSKKLKAGKRRTYFFDVRSTKQGDFFLTITESKRKFDGEGYDSHKIFLYKEDFKKFVDALDETIDYIKTELMPDYDFDAEKPPYQHHSETNDFSGSDEQHDNEVVPQRDQPSAPSSEEDLTWS